MIDISFFAFTNKQNFTQTGMNALLSLAEALVFGVVFAVVFRVQISDIDRSNKVDYVDTYTNLNLIRNNMYQTAMSQ